MQQNVRAEGSESAPAVTVDVPLIRIKKAYEQVADQIRALIITGQMSPDERLPNESTLATQFGVSRATIREALRVLSAQNLIRTAKGSQGGSFVTIPSIERISESLEANLGLLSHSDVTLEEFLEVRELLEVPAARLAAVRRSELTIERLRAAVPQDPLMLATQEQFRHNRDFHSLLVSAADNTLLMIAAGPIFTVLQTHLRRSTLGEDFHTCVNRDHRAILAAIESGDPEAAAEQTHEHLAYLRPMYERAWRYRRRDPD
jgi:DNA-binding FadR family transcriptional regulator